jgi:hypothetical protein
MVTTGLGNVAQETGFYSRELEAVLSVQIEGPANPVLDKLRARESISAEEKLVLSTYMITMLKRVPESQMRVKRSTLEMIPTVFDKLDEELAARLQADPAMEETIAKHREEAGRVRLQYETNLPRDFWLKLVLPQTASRALATLNAMTWRFLTYDKNSAFLTSDNPVYFHSGLGIGHPDSEVSFPISRDVVLWATWRGQEGFYGTGKHAVREINRRTASAATRYVFFSHEEAWVANLVRRKKFTLHSMA